MLPSIKPYIIGETAFHHQGDKDFLRNLVDAAAELQLDAIKFHLLFDINNYFVASHPAISAVNEWIFSKEQYADFFKYANEKKLDVIALCNDPASIQWINNE
ncbi:MAG TPA: hypothetical protein VFM70_11885, partial [Salinimicrobium sp.]|nr:hypothetical protein [Salinimicrobium sp.]